ncbi:hypothetical protein [Paenibacillus sp. 481]|uniref:hypothetical protein n=1 Tax=Paenibacillus sp. 481 TaxID=2835869 RepID=UPI001E28577C|nr:hypothetical protein [Paenibacillus sp. 481]UHA73909.1 hypothetical protein KIK04_01720 [Paenibacillus sp. 481]
MIKDKNFIVGIGAGMIIGAILLQLSLIGERASKPMSEQALRRAADQAGFDLVARGNVANELSLQGQKDTANVSEHKRAADSKAVSSGTAVSSSEDSKVTKGNASATGQPNKQPALPTDATKPSAKDKVSSVKQSETSQITVKVAAQSGSSEVAAQLAKAGVVASADAFEGFIFKHKKQRKLRTGTFVFNVPAEMADVLEIITSHPNG